MRRVALLLAVAALALAACGSKTSPRPVERASTASATVTDPRGDAVDVDGNPRRGRPDVDIVRVAIDRNSDRTRFTIATAGAARGPLRYEIFGQTPDVAGYDVVAFKRRGDKATGYVAFENSAARQGLQGLSVTARTAAVDVPIDPIFGASPFQWRVTLTTASGGRITDVVPGASRLRSFPRE